jgi:hypothetical protein
LENEFDGLRVEQGKINKKLKVQLEEEARKINVIDQNFTIQINKENEINQEQDATIKK